MVLLSCHLALYPAPCQGVDIVREASEPSKMGETLVLAGCPSQNLYAGPRWSFLGAVVEMFGVLWYLGCSRPCCLVQNGWVFSETEFDYFFNYYSCMWQNIVERLLQSACSPWLEGAVSASEKSHRGHGRWPYKSGVVLTSVRRVTGQFSIISGPGEVTKPS